MAVDGLLVFLSHLFYRGSCAVRLFVLWSPEGTGRLWETGLITFPTSFDIRNGGERCDVRYRNARGNCGFFGFIWFIFVIGSCSVLRNMLVIRKCKKLANVESKNKIKIKKCRM